MKNILQYLFLFATLAFYKSAQAQEVGLASYYHEYFNGKKTASGELYSDLKMTCAHKTLPLGTIIKVTNLENDRSVILKVNDRGPYVRDRILDLSRTAAQQLGYINKGMTRVSYEIISSDIAPVIKDTISSNTETDKFYQITPTDTATHLSFGIKIGSYEDAAIAFKISNELKQKNDVNVYVQATKLVKGYLYRIFLGNFNSADEAEELRRSIKGQYRDAYVIKYESFK